VSSQPAGADFSKQSGICVWGKMFEPGNRAPKSALGRSPVSEFKLNQCDGNDLPWSDPDYRDTIPLLRMEA